jgi:hypothetical protein
MYKFIVTFKIFDKTFTFEAQTLHENGWVEFEQYYFEENVKDLPYKQKQKLYNSYLTGYSTYLIGNENIKKIEIHKTEQHEKRQ